MKNMTCAIAAVFFLVFLVVSFAGCDGQFQSAHPIRSIRNLEGRKVGVELSKASDYFLSPRDGKDLYLYRYDTTADMLMALYYRQLDAVVVDDMEWRMLENTCAGLHRLDTPIGEDGFISYFEPKESDLCKDFNVFLEKFKKTKEYKDIISRQDRFDGGNYIWDENLVATGTGETIRAAFLVDDMYPICHIDSDGTPVGFEVELLVHFANQYNYQIDFTPTSYEDMIIGLHQGVYQIVFGGLSLYYSKDAQEAGLITSDPYYDGLIYMVEVSDYDAFQKTGINTGEYTLDNEKGGMKR